MQDGGYDLRTDDWKAPVDETGAFSTAWEDLADGFYTYILRCCDGSLYTGWTTSVARRLEAHNDGRGARYTRTRRPCTLVYVSSHTTRNEAMAEEFRIKHLTREEKLELISKEMMIKERDTH